MDAGDSSFYINVEASGTYARDSILEYYSKNCGRKTAMSDEQQSMISKFTGSMRRNLSTSQSIGECFAEILVDVTMRVMAQLGYMCDVECVFVRGKGDFFFVALRVERIRLHSSQSSCCGFKGCCRVTPPVSFFRFFFCCPTASFRCCPCVVTPLNVEAVSQMLEDILNDESGHTISIPSSVDCEVPENEKRYLRSRGFGDVKLPEVTSPPWWEAAVLHNSRLFVQDLGRQPPEISEILSVELLRQNTWYNPSELLDICLQDSEVAKQIGYSHCVLVQFLVGPASLALLYRVTDESALASLMACGDPLNERLKLIYNPVYVDLPVPLPQGKIPSESKFLTCFGNGNIQWRRMSEECAVQGCYIGVNLTSHWAAKFVMDHVGLSACVGTVLDLVIVDWPARVVVTSVRLTITRELERMSTSL
eukprot:gnl/MRDRNA2_/MRDRNA2_28606_c0_seq1.p1 gnl/MRDRNA2_/MRDRNA2_28606_c0~~gnl/MRDRNA2_/MRDRNA2_28606_c0_seq1.p1  ORF type:complete len:421 (-),score=40.61 gnl/MRDRNA2_/MRDRNA2_28606_c0_seq1:73-1335(-)